MFAIESAVAVAAVPPRPSLTDHVTVYGPASVKAGDPVSVAVRGLGPAAAAVNVKPDGLPVCVIVSASVKSTSVAVAVIVAMGVPSAPLAVAGAVIAGARFVFAIESAVAVAAVPPTPSLTDQVTV